MKNKEKLIALCEVGIFAAIAFVLDLLASLYSGYLFPNGGSLSFAMIPIIILSFRRGPVLGFICGLIVGLLDLVDGFYSITDTWYEFILQMGLDYFIGVAVCGLAGLFKPLCNKIKPIFVISIATFSVGLVKFLCHFASGVFFWPLEGAPIGDTIIYSLVYNGGYMLPTIIISTALMALLSIKQDRIFLLKNNVE